MKTEGQREFIESIITLQHEFQRRRNITGECIGNTQLLHEIISSAIPEIAGKIKAKAVIAFYEKEIHGELCAFTHTHVVLYLDEEGKQICDPSYEVYRNDPEYYESVKMIIERMGRDAFNRLCGKNGMKKLLEDLIDLQTFADRINRNNPRIIAANKKIYVEQRDFLRQIYKSN